jgi:hypothetical protein
MKLSIYSIAIMFALATISCSKESENNPQVTQKHQKVPTNQIQIEYSYDNVLNVIKGDDLRGKLSWYKRDKYEPEREMFVGNFYINYEGLGDITISDINDNNVVVSNRENVFNFLIREQSMNNVVMTITGSSERVIELTYLDSGLALQNFLGNIEVGQILNANDKFPWVLVWGAALLISAGVDYYCDNQIASDVAGCTENGMCSVVNSCSASCITCP